jgi:PIN domain nuclease of toxin-antitoxin system
LVRLLFDTQVLVWLMTGDSRLRRPWLEQLRDPDTTGHVSAVTAWEYSDLKQRGRLRVHHDIADLQALYDFSLVDFPADCWALAADLPYIHGDPVDRMLIAHAIALDMVLVTADAAMRSYPVKTLW